jgi:hypothetical protein
MMQQWQPDFLELNPLFNDLKSLFADQHWSKWPDCNALNQLLDQQLDDDVINQLGHKLTLVEQTEQLLSDGLYYEERIYLEAQVPTRACNWHDFFNAMIYILFPKLKQEINRLHYQDIVSAGKIKRTKCRNALTLLDECGVIIAYCGDEVKHALTEQLWQQAFVDNRGQWGQKIDGFIIGHANYEKALAPYIGFTAKALYVKVAPQFFKLDKLSQYHQLDQMIAQDLEVLMVDNRHLYPLPILGVPHWWPENTNPIFYDNPDYFRPKRMAK